MNLLLWFFVCLWPIMAIKSTKGGVFPPPPALVVHGIVLIAVNLIILCMLWWSSRGSVNPSKRTIGYLSQVTIGSMSLLFVGGCFIAIGLLTVNLYTINVTVGFYELLPVASWLVAVFSVLGFWLNVAASIFFWFGPRFRYINDRLPSGWHIRYKALRLEAFTDNTVAIAVTTLAMEFPVPLDSRAIEFIHRLTDAALYGLCFSILLMHWFLHYRMLKWLRVSDLPLFWMNVMVCFFMTMVPLALKIAFMADGYNIDHSSTSHWFCFFIMIGLGISHMIQCYYILRCKHLQKPVTDATPKLKMVIFACCAVTPIVALIVRVLAFFVHGQVVFAYFLAPVLNVLCYIFIT